MQIKKLFTRAYIDSAWGLYVLAFMMGLGFLKIEIGVLFLVSLLFYKAYLRQIYVNLGNPILRMGGCFLGLFFLFYSVDYVPYKPHSYIFELNYFEKLFFWSALAFLLPLAARSASNMFSLVWFMSLGVFVYALVTVVATLSLLPPPYYGKTIHLIGLARGQVVINNSPGIANLLCFLPIAFSAGLLLDKNVRPKGFFWIGIVGSVLALLSALQLQQRTFFLLVLILEPMIISMLLISLKRFRIGLIVLSIFLVYPILIKLDGVYGLVILPRKLESTLFTDARFEMFKFWFSHVFSDPFTRVEVGPKPWDSLFWFHNFFADVHRLSGIRPTLIGIVLFLGLFTRTIYLFRLCPAWGAYMLAVAIPTFMIANTSVVPEGERQPFLLLILLYSICESLLWQMKKYHCRCRHSGT